jgi:signal transduction histidine kinase
MRRFLPDSLAAWVLIILIAGLMVTEISTLFVVARSRAEAGRMMNFFHFSERVSSISAAIAAQDPEDRGQLAAALSDPTMTVAVEADPLAAEPIAADDELAELDDILQERLDDFGIANVHVERSDMHVEPPGGLPQSDGDAGPVERVMTQIAARYANTSSYIASIQLSDGTWINFVIPVGETASAATWWNNVALAAIVLAAVLAASIFAMRRLTAPFAMLANAADRFSRDINSPQLAERGPREVRAAAHAFNVMQERLQRFVSDRDHLVAAISHDLRTPATRLRLRAESVEGDERRRMLADLDEMEVMIRSVLAFASETAQPEPREAIDLISFLETVCDDTESAAFVPPEGLPPRLGYVAQPVALRRCVANLVTNAIKYGERARVALSVDDGAVRIRIDDDGPGIPPAQMETVFMPFRRLETSRNRETGGTGLGLTIARMVARAHGGDVTLCNRPEGGLSAEIVLPRAGLKATA